jgi:hypothetical protein
MNHVGDLNLDGAVMLKCIIEEIMWIRFIWMGCCKHGNETSGSIKGWKFHDQLNGY